jgi:hypothetical protein
MFDIIQEFKDKLLYSLLDTKINCINKLLDRPVVYLLLNPLSPFTWAHQPLLFRWLSKNKMKEISK